MRLRAHPPSIARATQRHAGSGQGVVPATPSLLGSRHGGARDESVPVERRLLAGFRRCRIGDRWLAASGTVAS
jgi:hypothetical protein